MYWYSISMSTGACHTLTFFNLFSLKFVYFYLWIQFSFLWFILFKSDVRIAWIVCHIVFRSWHIFVCQTKIWISDSPLNMVSCHTAVWQELLTYVSAMSGNRLIESNVKTCVKLKRRRWTRSSITCAFFCALMRLRWQMFVWIQTSWPRCNPFGQS